MIRQSEWTVVRACCHIILCLLYCMNAHDKLYIFSFFKKKNFIMIFFFIPFRRVFAPMQRIKRGKIVKIKMNDTIEWNDAIFIAITLFAAHTFDHKSERNTLESVQFVHSFIESDESTHECKHTHNYPLLHRFSIRHVFMAVEMTTWRDRTCHDSSIYFIGRQFNHWTIYDIDCVSMFSAVLYVYVYIWLFVCVFVLSKYQNH